MGTTRSRSSIAVMAAVALAAGTAVAATGAGRDAVPSQAEHEGKPVLIRTVVRFPEGAPARGTILRAFVGQRSVCRRASFEDEFTEQGILKRIDCPRGDLVIRFLPEQHKRNQSSTWKLVDATGEFRGLTGGGTMFVRSAKDAPRARETFTGTVR